MAKHLNAQSYSLLLKALAHDERAAEAAFLQLRNSLVKFFELRGDNDPVEAVDETLDRVSLKLGQEVAIEQITKYSFGVARLVFLENLRNTQRTSKALKEFGRRDEAVTAYEETDSYATMRDCFSGLSEKNRDLLKSYFADVSRSSLDEKRQHLAVETGLSINGLRLRIFRLRKQLEDCVRGKAVG